MDTIINRRPHGLTTTQRADRNAAAVYLASLSQGSRRTMEGALDTIAGVLGAEGWRAIPWHELRFQHAALVRSELKEQYAASTTNKMLSALRGTLKAAWKLGQMPAEDYHKATSIENVTGETPDAAAGRALSRGEYAALMEACIEDESPAGVRDAAMLALAYACGLRRAEIVGLNVGDYDDVTQTLTVRGKRNKTRTVPLMAQGAVDALTDWLALRGHDAGALFVRIDKGGYVTGDRLTPQAIYYIMSKRASEAGVDSFSPHDMRRTFISDLLDFGADISTVQRLAGHADSSTTASYDRRGERAKRDAVGLLHVPYRRRS